MRNTLIRFQADDPRTADRLLALHREFLVAWDQWGRAAIEEAESGRSGEEVRATLADHLAADFVTRVRRAVRECSEG